MTNSRRNKILKIILVIILVENVSKLYQYFTQPMEESRSLFLFLVAYRVVVIIFSIYFILKKEERNVV